MTMKKTYMAPAAQAITFDAMTMLAASPELKVNTDKEVDASTSFSGEKGWSSDSWSDED
jgi:hypothetical protein